MLKLNLQTLSRMATVLNFIYVFTIFSIVLATSYEDGKKVSSSILTLCYWLFHRDLDKMFKFK